MMLALGQYSTASGIAQSELIGANLPFEAERGF
jgi:hypothetical protein